jgi:hypothetical protein
MSEDASNVIKFPNKTSLPTTKEEAQQSIMQIRDEYFNEVSAELARELFIRALNLNFDVSSTEAQADCILVVECVKSLLMKTQGMYYPFQDIANDICDDSFIDDVDDLLDDEQD